MRWITRERPKIDRVACPWLISRFIDTEPEFIFVAPDEAIALIVRGADTDRRDLTPESDGLFAISLGLSNLHAGDDDAVVREWLRRLRCLISVAEILPDREASLVPPKYLPVSYCHLKRPALFL